MAHEEALNFIARAPIITRKIVKFLGTFHEEDGGRAMLKSPYYQATATYKFRVFAFNCDFLAYPLPITYTSQCTL